MNNLEILNNLEANENDNVISYKSLEQNKKKFTIIIIIKIGLWLCKKNFFSYINKRCIKKYNTKLLPIYNKIKKKQIKEYFSKTIKKIFYDCISKGYTLEDKKQNIEKINLVLENEKNDPNSKIKILNILFNKTFLEIFRMYLYDKPFIELFHNSKSVFFLIRFKTFKNDLKEYSITQKNIYIKNLEKYLASKDIILTAP